MQDFYKQQGNKNAEAILINLLTILKVPVTKLSIETTLSQQDSYPSLSAIDDSLREWDIETMAVKLHTSDLEEVSFPVIAHTKSEKGSGDFILISQYQADSVTILDTIEGYKKLTIAEFENIWDGILLLVEANPNSGQKNYAQIRRQEIFNAVKMPFVLGFFATLLLIALWLGLQNSTNFIADIGLFATKIIGTALSFLLVIKQFDKNNPLANKFCNLNKKNSCDGVLSSPAAKIWGIGMAEIGALFFSGSLLSLFFGFISQTDVQPILALLALLALPYPFFSVYYQAYKVKSWCPLCLGVMAVLVVEAIITIPFLDFGFLNLKDFFVTALGFGLPLMIWTIIRPFVASHFVLPSIRKELLRFKNDKNLFYALLERQNPIDTGVFSAEFELGNPEAENVLIVATNPTCPPCAMAHAEIEKLANLENLRILIRFMPSSDEESVGNQVIRHSLALYSEDSQKAHEALSDWFKNQAKRDVQAWKNRFPLTTNIDQKQVYNWILEYYSWASQYIRYTPTLILNEREVPTSYQARDLRNFLK